jgi:hypothetical protein
MEIKNAMTILMRTGKIYKPISVRAAKFFYLCADLVKLNTLYQFTHEWFFAFFLDLVRKFPWRTYANSPKNREKGLNKLRKRMTKQLFNQVSQTLFEKDILLFAFLMSYYELDSELKCDMRQVEFFIKGNLAQESEIYNTGNLQQASVDDIKMKNSSVENKERAEKRQRVAPWISAKQWQSIDKLSTLPPFNQPNRTNMEPNLACHVENNPMVWLAYVNDKEFLNMTMNNSKKPTKEPMEPKKKKRAVRVVDREDKSSSDDDDDDDEDYSGEDGDEFSDEEGSSNLGSKKSKSKTKPTIVTDTEDVTSAAATNNNK